MTTTTTNITTPEDFLKTYPDSKQTFKAMKSAGLIQIEQDFEFDNETFSLSSCGFRECRYVFQNKTITDPSKYREIIAKHSK